jgi:uncharacterized protein YkwD
MRSPRTIAIGLALVVGITALAVPGSAASRLERRRDNLLAFVNEYRRDHGLVGLRFDPDLNQIAQRHSKRMAEERRLFHTNDLGAKLRSFRMDVWGENLGYADTVFPVFKLWTKSPSHDYNLLRRGYRRAGIGVFDHAGRLWITMMYYG